MIRLTNIIGALGMAGALSTAFPKDSQSQIKASAFSSMNYKSGKGGLDTKSLSFGTGIFYESKKEIGFGIQYRSPEVWKFEGFFTRTIKTRTMLANLYFFVPDSVKFFAGSSAGIYGGIGIPIESKIEFENQGSTFIFYQTDDLKKSYFEGVFIQINFGKDFSKAHVSSFIRTEGGGGIFKFHSQKYNYPKAGGSLSLGISIKPHKKKSKEIKEQLM